MQLSIKRTEAKRTPQSAAVAPCEERSRATDFAGVRSRVACSCDKRNRLTFANLSPEIPVLSKKKLPISEWIDRTTQGLEQKGNGKVGIWMKVQAPKMRKTLRARATAPARNRTTREHNDGHQAKRNPLFDEVQRCLESARVHDRGVADEVLLDKRLDGCRLLLIRTQSESNSAINLSPRELEISRMIAKGYPNKMIAAVLEISTWTVGTHLRRIFAKVHVSSRAAMVAQLAEIVIEDLPHRATAAQPAAVSPFPLPKGLEPARAVAKCGNSKANIP